MIFVQQEKTNALVETVRLFEKGLTSFEGADRVALEKHLVKKCRFDPKF